MSFSFSSASFLLFLTEASIYLPTSTQQVLTALFKLDYNNLISATSKGKDSFAGDVLKDRRFSIAR